MIGDVIAHWPMWVTFAIIIVAVTLYISEAVAMEVVSVALIIAFLLLFLLPGATSVDGAPVSADSILAGFSNPALISIMALLVIGQGLFQTGALDSPSRVLLNAYERSATLTLLGAYFAVFVISAFINNTPVVVMFLPILSALAMRMGTSTSKLMMPLSFVSVFAGMTTLIGTSTNLLSAEILERSTGTPLNFFDLTETGLILAGVGAVYLLLFSRFLPKRAALSEDLIAPPGKQFIVQIEITKDHPLHGKSAVAGMFKELPNITIRLIQRGERSILPPFEDTQLQEGDLLIVAATRKALTSVLQSTPEMLRRMWQNGNAIEGSHGEAPKSLALTEAIIAPGSRMINASIEQAGFRRRADAIVLGIQRRSRMIRTRLNDVRLQQGDTLLICSAPNALNMLAIDRDLLVLEGARVEVRLTTPILLARLIAVGVVVAAATGVLPILHASVLGAVAMVLGGCLNVRQAGRALDLRVYLLIAAAIAMGTALQVTGGAGVIAQGVIYVSEPFGPLAMLSMVFLTVAVLTNVLSNAATAVLFTPIAISTAQQAGLDPLPFVFAVIYAANCCFATPIAYQTNLLVMGAGHYRFVDFIRFGGPLVIVLWITFTLIAPMQFDLQP